MIKLVHIILFIFCLIVVITGVVAADIWQNVEFVIEDTANPVSNTALSISQNILSRYLNSGRIDKILPEYSPDKQSKLILGELIPIYSIYNPVIGATNGDQITDINFLFKTEITEWGTFIFLEGKNDPILFLSIILENNEWKENSLKTLGKSSFGDSYLYVNLLKKQHAYSDLKILSFLDSYAFVYKTNDAEMIIPSPLLQHLLAIPDMENDLSSCSRQEFIEDANKLLDRIQSGRLG
jgi:hypothetical protein